MRVAKVLNLRGIHARGSGGLDPRGAAANSFSDGNQRAACSVDLRDGACECRLGAAGDGIHGRGSASELTARGRRQ